MPQTLLAISAIVIASFLTLSQSEISRRTTASVVTDQFELAVAGTLLHTMEFVDSRAFDEATTPDRLRERLKLPRVMSQAARDTITFDDLRSIRASEFTPASAFGAGNCDIKRPPATCDDVDDIADGRWHALDLETPEGDPLPVEVKVDVAYVRAGSGDQMDVPVGEQTFHKRVEVIARSNAVRMPGGGSRPVQVALRRVISFDSEVAVEYLRRSIRTPEEDCRENGGAGGKWELQLAELQRALAEAQAAEQAAALVAAEAETTRSTLASLLGRYTTFLNGAYYRAPGVTDAQWTQTAQAYEAYVAARDRAAAADPAGAKAAAQAAAQAVRDHEAARPVCAL